MSLRMILSSTDSSNYFNNSPNNFTVQLNRQVQFDGYWVVAVTDFNIKNYKQNKTNEHEIFLYCDICQETFVGGREIPLLRRIVLNSDQKTNIIFTTPYYIPLKVSQLQQIKIYIKNRKGDPVSFQTEEVTLTLHFKKFPYIL